MRGLINLGSGFCGTGAPIAGEIFDLAASQSMPLELDVTFAHEGGIPGTQLPVVYVDSELRQVLAPGVENASIGGLIPGEHRVEVFLMADGAVPRDRHRHFGGKHAWITWPWITAPADVESVDVYYSGSLGGGFLASPAFIANVATRIVERKSYSLCDGGTGTGRLSSYGQYLGDGTDNGLYTITITGPGTADYDGLLSGSFTFEPGITIQLPLGVFVQFHDALDDYATNDEFLVHVGIQNFYRAGELPEGLYYFGVRAKDFAGNADSTASIDPSSAVKIVHAPGSVTGAAWSYDSGTGVATLSWTDPSDVDLAAVRVYTNWDPVTETFHDHIYERIHYASVAAGVEEWMFDTTDIDGALKVYLRPIDSTGNENQSIELLAFNCPPTAEDLNLVLNPPINLQAEAAAAGAINVSWDYLVIPTDENNDADSMDSFAYWIDTSPPDFSTTPTGTFLDSPDNAIGILYMYSETLAGPYVNGTTYYIGVRATDGAGNYSANTNYISVVADTEAPGLSLEPIAVAD